MKPYLLVIFAGIYYFQDVFYKRGNPQAAVEAYRRAIELNPEYAAAYYGSGYIYDELEQHDRAIRKRNCRLLQSDQPGTRNSASILSSGRVLPKPGKPDCAAKNFKRAVEIDPGYAPIIPNSQVFDRPCIIPDV